MPSFPWRMFLKTFLSLLLLASAATARQPNIVLILADDLGPGDLGAYGQTKIKTPHLDRMAAEGMKLTRHYCGNAVCAPSRSVLMTGMHPGHTYIRDNRGTADNKVKTQGGIPTTEGQHPIPEEAKTMAEVMRDLGYATGGFGKWGLGGPHTAGAPLKQGFQRWFGYNCQGVAHNFYPVYLWDNDKIIPLNNPDFPAHDTFKPGEDPTKPESYKRFQGQEYSADLIAEQARAYLREHKDEPFFLYLPHNAVHFPLYPHQEFMGKSGVSLLKDWVLEVDWTVGQILSALDEAGVADNTIVFFTSDNGGLSTSGADNTPLRGGKGSTLEGGIRVCTLARWPGRIAGGGSTNAIHTHMDWLPTFAALGGGQLPTGRKLDGMDISKLLLGDRAGFQPRDTFFYYRGFKLEAVRSGPWKLHLASKELYDLDSDLAEADNLAPAMTDKVAELTQLASTMQNDLGLDGPEAPGVRPLGRVKNPRPFIPADQP